MVRKYLLSTYMKEEQTINEKNNVFHPRINGCLGDANSTRIQLADITNTRYEENQN